MRVLQGLRRETRDRERSGLRWKRTTSPDFHDEYSECPGYDARSAGNHAGHRQTDRQTDTLTRKSSCGQQAENLRGQRGADAFQQNGDGRQQRSDGDEQRIICIEMTSTKNTIVDNEVCPTLTARMGTGGNQVNSVLQKQENQ